MSEIDRRVRTATHEAGHATISRALGLPSGEATIGDGRARSYLADDHGIRSILVALAGGIAEEVLLGDANEVGCLRDHEKVNRLLTANHFTDSALASAALRDECRDLVRKHRGTIAVIALQLLAKETLTADEIDALMGSP